MSTPRFTSSTSNRWLPVLPQHEGAGCRLFCFPYAGGSAHAFADWSERLWDHVEVRPVQLPGRFERMRDPAVADFSDLVGRLGNAMRRLLDRPFAFFGHSMGALVAFETTRYLRRHHLPMPVHLYVSGRRAPQISYPSSLATLPDDQFIAWIQSLDGTPAAVLNDAELMTVLLPVLRSDCVVCSTYRWYAEPPLTCPISVFSGREDPEIGEGHLEGWREHTTAGFSITTFPGGHFSYVQSPASPLLTVLDASLQRELARLPSRRSQNQRARGVPAAPRP